MKITPQVLPLFTGILLAGLSVGCNKNNKEADSPDMLDKDGPMEKAGEAVDDAADDAKDAVDEAAENTEDAVEDTD